MKTLFLSSLFIAFFSGCAGVGIVYTSNQYQKLENATVLFEQQDRPLAAKRLILEVMTTCEEEKIRPHADFLPGSCKKVTTTCEEAKANLCLAKAWETYGSLLQSESARRWASLQGESAFPADRYDQSAQYYGKAATVFVELENHGDAANAYLGQERAFELAGRKVEACAAYLKTLDQYNLNNKAFLSAHPDAKPFVPRGFSSYADWIAAQRKRVGCE
jgi:tetratricopeptide (TPR) repeat protein